MSERKMVCKREDIDSLNYESLDDAILKLTKLKETLTNKKCTQTTLVIDTMGYESVYYQVEYLRPETDEEYEDRLAEEKEKMEKARKKLEARQAALTIARQITEHQEREEYERLKKKYGSN